MFNTEDTVQIRAYSLSLWVRYYSAFGEYCSRETFQVIGMWLKKGPRQHIQQDYGDGYRGDDREQGYYADFYHEERYYEERNYEERHCAERYHEEGRELVTDLSEVIGEAVQDLCIEEEEDSDLERAWEEDCWIYQLEPTDSSIDMPIADVMLWREHNLVFDAEAMDPVSDCGSENDEEMTGKKKERVMV